MSVQARKTLRGAAVRMATPALHDVIVNTKAQSQDIAQYFRVKREKGSFAVPKPVLNAAALAELMEKFNTTTDVKTCVHWVLACIEEFSTNHDLVREWTDYHYGVCELFCNCLHFILKSQRTEISKVVVRLCNVITSVADKSELLSTRLFNKCSKALLSLVFEKDISVEVKSVILIAMGNLCPHVNRSLTANAFLDLALYLRVIVQRFLLRVSVEAQLSIYYILHSSLTSKEQALEAASIWFGKWPSLRDAFVPCYLKNLNEGCGIFLEKLHEVKTSGDRSIQQTLARSCAGRTPAHTLTQGLAKGSGLVDDTGPLKKPTDSKVSVNPEPSAAFRLSQSNISKPQDVQHKRFHTPYYPDHRKSLCARQSQRSVAESGQDSGNSGSYQADDASCSEKRGSKRAQVRTIDFLQPKLKRFGKGKFEQFDISKSNETNVKRALIEVKPEKLEEEDGRNSKVEKWLSSSCSAGNLPSSGSNADDDIQIISEPKFGTSGRNPTCQNYQGLVLSNKFKREDSPQISISTSNVSSTLTKFTKSDKDLLHQVKCKDMFSNVESQKLNQTGYGTPLLKHTSTHDSKNLWARKVRELDQAESKKPKGVKDVYFFEQSKMKHKPPEFKKPKTSAVKKTPAIRKKAPEKCLPRTENVGKVDKENIPPVSRSSYVPSPKVPGTCLKSAPKNLRIEGNVNCAPAAKPGTAYSPILDDSNDLLVDEKKLKVYSAQNPTVAVKTAEIKSAATQSGGWRLSGLACSSSNSTVQALNCGPDPSPASNCSKPSNSSVAPSTVRAFNGSLASDCSGLKGRPLASCTSPANAVLVGHSSAASDIVKVGGQPLKSPTSPVNASCSMFHVDSGLEVTSNDEENKTLEKQAKTHYHSLKYLKLKLAELTEQASAANSQLTTNNATLSTEMTEIKGLAAKLTASVGRCENVVNSNNKELSDQAGVLKGYSRTMDNAIRGDQRHALREQLRARNRERIIQAVKMAIESRGYESSDSD
ncbi:hypothetical protein ONE63_004922 [Megalurothrips usitatus]|uniref:Uncharacterized protein n=1 Tax=Megalurothrips usitatus TaxID=439358 RepID=A0AAV7X227_9NEOP|nr:hypothetical protein ONE63_004922 [Megalurothrips usitatus]